MVFAHFYTGKSKGDTVMYKYPCHGGGGIGSDDASGSSCGNIVNSSSGIGLRNSITNTVSNGDGTISGIVGY